MGGRRETLKKITYLFIVLIIPVFILAGCADKEVISSKSTGNPEYENQKIMINGDIEESKEITVAEMRQFPQKEMQGSFQRASGEMETFTAAGPAFNDVMDYLEIDLADFKGIGFVGKDSYYCLVTPDIINNREMLLALAIDGNLELAENMRPARLCVKDEFGPYWVRMVDQITLYKEIPQKEISSVWIFDNLAAGIEPYPYEYYGSKDNAIELAQIFSRLDYVNSKAFFTIKSADGFVKNEAISSVINNYYIKVSGNDAPMNIAPNIKLGMNVKHIAWISTNADAAVFPEEMLKLIGRKKLDNTEGLGLKELLEEVQVQDIEEKQFEVIGTAGERVLLNGQDLSAGLIIIKDDGTCPVVWQEGTPLQAVDNLLRIRSVD